MYSPCQRLFGFQPRFFGPQQLSEEMALSEVIKQFPTHPSLNEGSREAPAFLTDHLQHFDDTVQKVIKDQAREWSSWEAGNAFGELCRTGLTSILSRFDRFWRIYHRGWELPSRADGEPTQPKRNITGPSGSRLNLKNLNI
ncbi:hypothetical protein N7533_008918 [Penicillium manginii]|jgi:hypothetical protein|uniref:uncharacterized protein n=1 Tax=Penicillium manginii TaxID=203109 RepID=UPI0025479B42|nr:uncharacterized protein N7533_008918 [Penicillium manginii]KAJ5744048.1 hypothetical protein N7533_008918 [Penicillium manginii]